MVPALMSWVLAVWVVVTCLSVAVPVWKRAGLPSGPSRRSVVAGLMEAAWFAGLMRLVVSWSPGSVVLWVVAMVVLAAAVAGAVLRWPVLPGRGSKSEGPVRETASGASTGPEDAEPVGSELVPKPNIPAEESDQSRRPQSATAGTAIAESTAGPGAAMEAAPVGRSRRPLLPVRERAAASDSGKSYPGSSDPGSFDPGSPDPGNPGRGKSDPGKAAAGMPRRKAMAGMPRRKAEAGKKMKKEPGNLALAGNAALLLAVVVISFLAG